MANAKEDGKKILPSKTKPGERKAPNKSYGSPEGHGNPTGVKCNSKHGSE